MRFQPEQCIVRILLLVSSNEELFELIQSTNVSCIRIDEVTKHEMNHAVINKDHLERTCVRIEKSNGTEASVG